EGESCGAGVGDEEFVLRGMIFTLVGVGEFTLVAIWKLGGDEEKLDARMKNPKESPSKATEVTSWSLNDVTVLVFTIVIV
ncbi:MAG: hypothetical protein PHI63_03480, partial [Patescibacteria group bacterium]|nr:hypothetical protein [Patescibacteria group bacterium]